jgi:hypothetical protein
MRKSEVEEVLSNWIEQALSPVGRLPEGTRPAEWVAANFCRWWWSRVEDQLGEAEAATSAARDELAHLGGWERCGEALDELCRAQERLSDLRATLGLADKSE